MPKRPKVDRAALDLFFPDPKTQPPASEQSAEAASPESSGISLEQKIASLREWINQLEPLLDPKEFKTLTCQNLK